MIGTAWAAANLDRLRGMVVTNTVAFDGFPWFRIARQWGDASPYGRIRSALGLAALGLNKGALFKRLFADQCPQLDEAQLERFTRTFALNRGAKRTTLRQFRQFMQPGFFKEFEKMRERILSRAPCRVLWGDQDSSFQRDSPIVLAASKSPSFPMRDTGSLSPRRTRLPPR
jgi:pimeloyl-ACP methyl ester carboxylesterase